MGPDEKFGLLPEGGQVVAFQSLRERKHLQRRNRCTELCVGVGRDATRDLQDAVICCLAVALIIVPDEYDRKDRERKDHACNQQTQAKGNELPGKEPCWYCAPVFGGLRAEPGIEQGLRRSKLRRAGFSKLLGIHCDSPGNAAEARLPRPYVHGRGHRIGDDSAP